MAADVGLAELRERRKQKILLNTEKRMNKLLGYKTEKEGRSNWCILVEYYLLFCYS